MYAKQTFYIQHSHRMAFNQFDNCFLIVKFHFVECSMLMSIIVEKLVRYTNLFKLHAGMAFAVGCLSPHKIFDSFSAKSLVINS
jgi:hypothetical protein